MLERPASAGGTRRAFNREKRFEPCKDAIEFVLSLPTDNLFEGELKYRKCLLKMMHNQDFDKTAYYFFHDGKLVGKSKSSTPSAKVAELLDHFIDGGPTFVWGPDDFDDAVSTRRRGKLFN